MNQEISNSQTNLFVYIPCHEDIADAIEQAKFLENESNILSDTQINLKICISYNGQLAEKYKTEYQDSKNREYIFNYELTGDLNISLGLLKSTFLNFDYIWILSANDKLNRGCLIEIIKSLKNQNCFDLISFGEAYDVVPIREMEVLANNSSYKLGLISSVIYNRESFQISFSQGIKYQNTGWGHLAVLLDATKRRGPLQASIIPSNLIFKLKDDSPESIIDFLQIFKKYFHSFYGLPVLIYLLCEKKIASKYFIKWYLKHLRYFYFYDYIENMLDPKDKANKHIFDSLVLKDHAFINIFHFVFIDNIISNATFRIVLNRIIKKVSF